MVKTVMIDAGHGGYDGGAEGNGLKEKDLTLAISLRAEQFLKSEYEGVRVLQTRRADKYLSLKQRSDMSNANKVDLFVSVHINSAGSITANGYESYISPYTSAKPMLSVVHKEIANYFQANNIRNRGLKELAYYVLRYTHAPAILTENLFIVNPTEARFLRNNIDRIAKHHAIGIAKALRLNKKTKADAPTKEREILNKKIEALEKEVRDLRRLVGDGKAGVSLAPTVKRAVELGITDGTRMGEPATREEVVAMITRTVDKGE